MAAAALDRYQLENIRDGLRRSITGTQEALHLHYYCVLSYAGARVESKATLNHVSGAV